MEQIEDEVRRFESELAAIRQRAQACVTRFREADTDLQYLLAERLGYLGSLVLPELQLILEDPNASVTLRYLAAWVALRIGDRDTSVDVLRAEIAASSEWSLPAAHALARYDVDAAVDVINAKLEGISLADDSTVVGYLTALRDLDGALTATARRHVLADSSTWISQVVEADFPDTNA